MISFPWWPLRFALKAVNGLIEGELLYELFKLPEVVQAGLMFFFVPGCAAICDHDDIKPTLKCVHCRQKAARVRIYSGYNESIDH